MLGRLDSFRFRCKYTGYYSRAASSGYAAFAQHYSIAHVRSYPPRISGRTIFAHRSSTATVWETAIEEPATMASGDFESNAVAVFVSF